MKFNYSAPSLPRSQNPKISILHRKENALHNLNQHPNITNTSLPTSSNFNPSIIFLPFFPSHLHCHTNSSYKIEMETVPLSAHDDKENVPPLSADRIGPKLTDVGLRLKKGADGGMARRPLADITHLFVGSPVLTHSNSTRARGDASMLNLPSLYPKKRRALDDVDLLRVAARSAKSLRMGFR